MKWGERRVYELSNMTTSKRPVSYETYRIDLSTSKRLRYFNRGWKNVSL